MRSKKTFRSAKGFSLMELLMVMVITPMIFFAVYSSFSTGARLWVRLTQASPSEDLSIFYAKAGRDIRNMLRYQSIAFDGQKEEMTFAGTIEAPASLGGDRGIGAIRLYYDPSSRTVRREAKDLSRIYQQKEGATQILLERVTSFELSYYTSDPLEDELFWTSLWNPEPKKLPIAVRMKFTLEGSKWPYERTEYIPAGGLLK
jgi:prepilin-type N-terminal cleavage/methylation domain-containing protein